MTALNKTENCIDTVIFDIGRVLVDFQPDIPLNRHVPDPGLRSRLKAAVYSNPAWSEADRGILPEEEIIARFVAADPSLEKEIRAAYDWSWENHPSLSLHRGLDPLPEKPRLPGVLPVQLFPASPGDYRPGASLSLSGGRRSFFLCLRPDQTRSGNLLGCFSKLLISGRNGPCFWDDNRDNILAAEREGLHAILFTDYSQASEQLEAILSGEPAACQPGPEKRGRSF